MDTIVFALPRPDVTGTPRPGLPASPPDLAAAVTAASPPDLAAADAASSSPPEPAVGRLASSPGSVSVRRDPTAAPPPPMHDVSWTKLGARPKAPVSSTPSRQEHWSQVRHRTGKTKPPPQAPVFDLQLENRYNILDLDDFPPLPPGSQPAPPPPSCPPAGPERTLTGSRRRGLPCFTPAPQRARVPPAGPGSPPPPCPSPVKLSPRPLFPPTTLIIGDSIVRHTRFFNAVTRSFPGAKVLDILTLLPTLLKTLPTSIHRVIIHIGSNDTVLRQSELTKRHFTRLFNSLEHYKLSVFISGPIPTYGRGCERFSRVLSLHTWLQSACQAHSIAFVDNFNLFWNRSSFFRPDGLHPNHAGNRMLAANLQHAVHSHPQD